MTSTREHFRRDTGWHAVLMLYKYPVLKAMVSNPAEERISTVLRMQHDLRESCEQPAIGECG